MYYKHYLDPRLWKKSNLSLKIIYNICKSFNLVLDPVEYVVLPKMKIVYIVNSKVGCSLIKKILLKRELGNDINFSNYNNIHSYARKHGYTHFQISKKWNDYYWFTVFRDPIERVISLYNNKVKYEKSKYFKKYYYNKSLFNENINLNKFVDVIINIPTNLSDRHFKPQYKVLENIPNKISIDIHMFNDMKYSISNKINQIEESDFNIKINSSKKNTMKISNKIKSKLKTFYKKDYEYFK
tara:strand:+ start:181 stop:900 length:720 start_codon:yes stop_codon:yes gene_type:complete